MLQGEGEGEGEGEGSADEDEDDDEGFFVPHGYLSDNEGCEEDEEEVGAPVSISDKTSCRRISWSLKSREIGSLNYHIALKFDWHLGSSAAEVPVKSQSDWTVINSNLTASRLHKILR